MEFAKSMNTSDIVLHLWDLDRFSSKIEFKNALRVITSSFFDGMNLGESTVIPIWIKNNADWWSHGDIGDGDFIWTITYLIDQKIMKIPKTDSQTSISPIGKPIPDWVKNNADWWAQGLITDDDFIRGIQYLVEKGIIQV